MTMGSNNSLISGQQNVLETTLIATFEIPNDTSDTSVSDWWRTHQCIHPDFPQTAWDVVAVPAFHCAGENMSSVPGRIATSQRNCLSAQIDLWYDDVQVEAQKTRLGCSIAICDEAEGFEVGWDFRAKTYTSSYLKSILCSNDSLPCSNCKQSSPNGMINGGKGDVPVKYASRFWFCFLFSSLEMTECGVNVTGRLFWSSTGKDDPGLLCKDL
jgi:hypothetical protein